MQKLNIMKEIYLIEIHDMTDNRIHVYQIYAKSIEDAYLQAKVLHNHYRYVVGKDTELIAIIKKEIKENE